MYLTTVQFIAWNKVSTAIFIVKSLRWPGIEPGSTAWKAAMLTTIPPTHLPLKVHARQVDFHDKSKFAALGLGSFL